MTKQELEIAELHKTVHARNQQISDLQNQLAVMHQQLEAITNSNGWKWLQRAWRLKTAIAGRPTPVYQQPSTKMVAANTDSQAGEITSLDQLSDEEWLQVLIESITNPVFQNVELPGFPSEEVQRNFVGESAETALRTIYPFYCLIKKYSAELGHPLTAQSKVLDFGCGWGRCARFFMRDLKPENIYGVDVLPLAVNLCLESGIPGKFSLIPNNPPLDFPESSFDVIYAFSVFSHLPEKLAGDWVAEFSRLLRPGGLLIVTTQGRAFIEFCASFHGREHTFIWHQLLANSFVDTKKALADYDRGEFLHEANGGGDNPELGGSVYGDTLIPRQHVEREWTKYLFLRDFIDDPAVLSQALIVMQKSQ